MDNEKDKNEEILLGQMAYDELTMKAAEDKSVSEIVLDGQIDLFSIKPQEKTANKAKDADTSIKTAESKKKPAEKKSKQTKEETEAFNGEKFIYRSLDEVMHESMIPYTEHVVLDRALPRVEDGLKPVQRRILYSMLELGLSPDKPYRKSARIVGDCMGKYHPHGDSSVYDAMVRMSQDFSLREPLVKGHGNFGSIDGDSAAAMRYTEAKLTMLAMELLQDLDKETVPWSFNFDDTLKEPTVLPGRFPNLLVNGASGIAVGVATNIPPHNLEEVINGVIEYISNRNISLDEMMKFIKAPDFPTGGVILANDELRQAYETGKGKIIIRAKVEIENFADKKHIVITELPYQVNKASLLQKIAELKTKEKDKLSTITEIRDESDRTGLRAVIRLKKEANEQAILEYLYKSTQMQVTFGINMVAIAGGKPSLLSLLQIIDYYVEYQRDIVVKKSRYELNIAKEREHIVSGLLVAIANIDKVIKIIKSSESVSVAKTALKEEFNLSEKQTVAILDMRLARLVNLEILKLQQEIEELKKKIAQLEKILNSKKLQYNEVKTQLTEIKKTYKNPRRSQIKKLEEIIVNDFAEVEEAFAREVVIGITAGKTLKQIPIKNYALAQKELTKNSTLFDVHTLLCKCMSNDMLLLFTSRGNIVKIAANKIAEAKWRDKGVLLVDLNKNVDIEEYVIGAFALKDFKDEDKFFMYTKQGFIKAVLYKDLQVAKSFYQVFKLKDNDVILNIEKSDENKNLVIITQNGNGLVFEKDQISLQGRIAGGVLGINLEEGDCVIDAKQCSNKGSVTLITENGFAKKMPVGELNLLARYRKGQKVMSERLIYASFSETPSSIVLKKGEKLTLIGQRIIAYDNRTSKGKQIAKGKFTEAFIYQV